MPTNKDFLALYDEQKIALYEGTNAMPQLEAISNRFKINKKLEEVKKKKLEDFVNPGTLRNMKKALEKQGMSRESIKKEVNKFLIKQKEIQMRSVERQE